MNLTQTPRTPKWPYLLGDTLLLALACTVGVATTPLTPLALSVVFGCVALGAILVAVPYVLDALADQHAAERAFQERLEVQNQKLVQAAEVLSGTAAQIKGAHEAAAKAVHAAEALPRKLEEKIAEFTAQLAARDDEDKGAMAKELDLLRDTEAQRLTALVGSIQTATKDFAAIEKEARAALEAARREAAEAAPALAAALGAATTRAEAALNQSSTQAQNAIGAVETRAREALAVAESISSRLLDRTAALRQLEQELDAALQQKVEQLHAAARTIEQATAAVSRCARDGGTELSGEPEPAAAVAEPAPAETRTAALPVIQLSAFPLPKRDPALARASEPAPVPEAKPAAEVSAEPTTTTEMPPKREPRRKSAGRTLGEAVLPGFADSEVAHDAEPSNHSAPAKTPDGSTRLLVTAYIGIGNKVFIRGEGPGLNAEKGVPMEFLSIGKWAWQTTDAVDPVTIRILKNDDLEAQGEPITIPPGHHVEATPVFHAAEPF